MSAERAQLPWHRAVYSHVPPLCNGVQDCADGSDEGPHCRGKGSSPLLSQVDAVSSPLAPDGSEGLLLSTGSHTVLGLQRARGLTCCPVPWARLWLCVLTRVTTLSPPFPTQ